MAMRQALAGVRAARLAPRGTARHNVICRTFSLASARQQSKPRASDAMVAQLVGEEGLRRAEEDVITWRKRRQTVLTAVAKGYDIKRAVYLANLAQLQYFNQMWHSAKPGGIGTRHPSEFSLPLQFLSGYAAMNKEFPKTAGRAQPIGSQYDKDWELDSGTCCVRHGILFNSGTDALGMVFTNEKRRWVVLAIRGSTSRNDTVTNFSFDHVLWEHPSNESTELTVHRGFYQSYQSIQPAVRRTVRKLFETGNFDKLYITGHSLGGALATHAAIDLECLLGKSSQHAIVPSIECHTFGAPRVGNKSWAEHFDAKVPKLWRHVNDEDAVPSLPPGWAGFQHVGNLVHMNQNGIWVGRGTRSSIGVVEDGFQLSETASDHWMRGYKYMLREFRQALYVPDSTSVALAQAWQVYLNSRNFVRDVPVVSGRTATATSDVLTVASSAKLQRLCAPDRGLLVAVLNRLYNIGLYETDAVVKEAGRIANSLDYLWNGELTYQMFHFAFFSTLMEPHPGTRAVSMAQAIARATFNRFDGNSDGFLSSHELTSMCWSSFGLDVDMDDIRRRMWGVGLDPTSPLSFEEVFLWHWGEQLRHMRVTQCQERWLGVQGFHRALSPFPTPEETRMTRVTVPGKEFLPQPDAPPAASAAHEIEPDSV